ncbi:hypothetical protein [Roseateles sp. P5_E7]
MLRLLAALVVAASSFSAQAKVSVNTWLCFAQKQRVLDDAAQASLKTLAARAQVVARQHGRAEVAVVATYLPKAAAELPNESEARSLVVIKHLQDAGLSYKEQGLWLTPDVTPQDLGCLANQVAVEVEILFAHL